MEPKNYRPISLLPLISKVLEKVIHDQMQTFLTDNNIIYCYQSGFRKFDSTDTCLSYLNNKILKGIDCVLMTGLILIDLQKAFDTTDHEILLQKVVHLQFSTQSILWFTSYLTNRTYVWNAIPQINKCTLANNIAVTDILRMRNVYIPSSSSTPPSSTSPSRLETSSPSPAGASWCPLSVHTSIHVSCCPFQIATSSAICAGVSLGIHSLCENSGLSCHLLRHGWHVTAKFIEIGLAYVVRMEDACKSVSIKFVHAAPSATVVHEHCLHIHIVQPYLESETHPQTPFISVS